MILIIDDEAMIRVVAEDHPEHYEAPDTLLECEQRLRTKKYDAILMDQEISEWNYLQKSSFKGIVWGIEVTKKLKSGGYGDVNLETHVISFSSIPDEYFADETMIKPSDRDALYSVMVEIARRYER